MIRKAKVIRIDDDIFDQFAILSKERHISQNEYIKQLIITEILRLNPEEKLKQINQTRIELDYEEGLVKQQIQDLKERKAKNEVAQEEKLKEAIKRLRANEFKPVVCRNIANHYGSLLGINPDELIQMAK